MMASWSAQKDGELEAGHGHEIGDIFDYVE